MCDGKRAQVIRQWAQGNWQAHPWPAGVIIYNTHHMRYQAALKPSGKFFVAEVWFIEATDSQFALWVERIKEMRAMAAAALEKETAG